MPGRQVKNWRKYHALREQGYSKEDAARIVNAKLVKRRSKRARVRSAAARARVTGS